MTEDHKPATAPRGLGKGGRALWRSIATDYDLDVVQRVQLEEACRAKDRLDKLDAVLRGDVDVWMTLNVDEIGDARLEISGALTQANSTANLMKQLLAAMRLEDPKTGKKPQYRGPRGAQKPSTPGGSNVSSIDRARAAKTGS